MIGAAFSSLCCFKEPNLQRLYFRFGTGGWLLPHSGRGRDTDVLALRTLHSDGSGVWVTGLEQSAASVVLSSSSFPPILLVNTGTM